VTWLGADELDLLVLGSGVAGLSAAVRAADELALRVGVLTKSELSQAATRWAQGGVAAVLAGDPDSTDLHLADTLSAGADLCDVDAVRVLVAEGPSRVNELIAMGAMFDRDREGRLQLAREGGHSMPRIVHAGGAATGAEIERALVEEVRETAVACWEQWFALDLLVDGGRCVGVAAMDQDGQVIEIRSRHVLLATGGAGQLYAATTNPLQSTGDGLAMALRAGAACADIEFVQFHPTALLSPKMPRPLLSEALRGHGALIRDLDGKRFVDELQPRDVVSRAITHKMLEEDADHMLLDATGLERFDERFPTIAADLRSAGLDPARDFLPIAPAAHYHCGGIVTDLDGASSLPGLWAAGEVACTGVHGANRLASNSLLEGMVFGARVIEAIGRGVDGPSPTGAMRAVVMDGAGGDVIGGRAVELPDVREAAVTEPAANPVEGTDGTAGELRDHLQRAMTRGAGVLRDARSLRETSAVVAATLGATDGLPKGPEREELRNLATVGWALLRAAEVREESRGCHTRDDFPDRDPAFQLRLVLR
jgi:L-aspartate oxidase